MKSILETHPDLAKQWHPTLNMPIEIAKVGQWFSKKVWWLGDCGHEWDTMVSNRIAQESGCPYCSGKRVLSGVNDLATTHPKLSEDWHPTKNGKLNPQLLSAGSSKKAWWLSKDCGHEWITEIKIRAISNSGCPYCFGQKVLIGFNDLKSQSPIIAAEWHPTKNQHLSSEQVRVSSNKKVWWLCKANHEWEANIDKRTLSNRGCPICSGNKVLIGFNDLATTHPHLVIELAPELNNGVSAYDISAGHKDKLVWRCKLNHVWTVSAGDRTNYNTGCPVCSGRKTLAGFNDFQSQYPTLSQEWDTKKNMSDKPNQFTAGSNLPFWWLCQKDSHSWQTTICARVQGAGCPSCSNSVSSAEQDIADYISSLNLVIEQSNRKILSGQEIDIYVPSKKIGIEYNGVYWHTEARGKNSTYHYNKWLKAKEAGIQLIQIWEDDWNKNPEQIKSMLAHKLGMSIRRKIYARSTICYRLTALESKMFLNENHIQGFASASYYYGLKDKDGVLQGAISLQRKANNTFEIIRYATALNVVGGFSKLVSYFEKIHQPDVLTTFSDHCVSDGRLYSTNGFEIEYEIPPDYKYLVNGSRVHKFSYRLQRFKNDSSLLWAENLTEKELAILNGLARIWDAGKTKWIRRTK